MSNSRFSQLKTIGFFCLCLALPAAGFAASDTDASTSSPGSRELLQASNETQRAYLQLQQQIHETKLTMERVRQEAEDASAKSAESVANRLQVMEQSVAEQRMRELEAIQSTTRFMLIVLSAFATLGFAAVVLTAYFQWRTVSRLAQVSSSLANGNGFVPTPAGIAALGLGEGQLVPAGPAEQSSSRLLGVIDRLEKRVNELEHTSNGSSKHDVLSNGGTNGGTNGPSEPAVITVTGAGLQANTNEVMTLLEKGQSLLAADQPDEAIACFDEVLALQPDHAEALVKKGAALEKLRKPQDAIECYNRAIAADSSLTIAYLHKGGLYNRLERFGEAVECYEQALRTQEKRHGG